MAIDFHHALVPARNRDASARQLAELPGVAWGQAAIGPFANVYRVP